jgi:hypothetical protein
MGSFGMSTTWKSLKVNLRSSAKKIPEVLKLQCPKSIWKLGHYAGFPFGK